MKLNENIFDLIEHSIVTDKLVSAGVQIDYGEKTPLEEVSVMCILLDKEEELFLAILDEQTSAFEIRTNNKIFGLNLDDVNDGDLFKATIKVFPGTQISKTELCIPLFFDNDLIESTINEDLDDAELGHIITERKRDYKINTIINENDKISKENHI